MSNKLKVPALLLVALAAKAQTGIDLERQSARRTPVAGAGEIILYLPLGVAGAGLPVAALLDPLTHSLNFVNGRFVLSAKPPVIVPAPPFDPSGTVDFSRAVKTAPFRTGIAFPAACDDTIREFFYLTPNNTLYVCNGQDLWAPVNGGGPAPTPVPFPRRVVQRLTVGGNMAITSDPVPGWPIEVQRNGIGQDPLSAQDYTMSGLTIVPAIANPWSPTDTVIVYYWIAAP